jgi:hypothetical protein
MKTPAYEGIFVALVPQRGSALLELLRDAARQFLGDKADPSSWSLELGPLSAPAGAVAFRLTHASDPFPWRDGRYDELARLVSKLGPGRCWALSVEKLSKAGVGDGWAEGVHYDRGERRGHEEGAGAEGPAGLLAWFGEQLALSENEVLALFEAPDQRAGLVDGGERGEDEIDLLLDKARKEYQRYQQLKEQRERSQS